MTYDEIAALFLCPLAEPIAAPELPDTLARRLRDALEPIATQGWWSPAAGEGMDRLDLPFLHGYVWGRAASLGSPVPSVVVSAFGVFEPAMLAAVYTAGAELASRDDVLAMRAEGGAAGVGAVASDEEADAIAGPLLRAVGELGVMGRPLFGALLALPEPPTPAGRLWRAAELVREHRSDGHIAALAVAGLDAVEANVLTEVWLGYPVGEYSGTRGFAPEVIEAGRERLEGRGWMEGAALTDAGRSARFAIEAATDRSQQPLVDALIDAHGDAHGDDLSTVIDGASAISERLVAAGSFPPDPRKRAGG